MVKDYEMLRTNEKLMLGAIIYEYWDDGRILNKNKKFTPKSVGFVNCYEVSYYLYIMSNFIVGCEIAKRPYPLLENANVSSEIRSITQKFEEADFIDKLEFISYISKDFYSSSEFRKINLFKNLTEDYSFLDIYENIKNYLKKYNKN